MSDLSSFSSEELSANPYPASRASGASGASATQSLDRALALLDVVVAHAVQGIALGDAAEAADLSKPTAHRLLTGLRNAGLVDYVNQQRLYFPAFKLSRMGQAVNARFDIVQLAAPSLQRLAQETGDTVYLLIRSGDYAVCAARTSGDYPVKMLTLDLGDTRPLGLGSNGLALLSALPDEECTRIVERHAQALRAYPHYAPDVIGDQIAATRRNGYALNQGQMLPEMSAVAMGIRMPGGDITASVSVAALTSRLQQPRLDQVIALVQREVAEMEARLTRSPSA